MARIDVAFDPILGCAAAVLVERVLVARLLAIELRAAQEHRFDAARLGTVRVLVGLDLRVMLTMHGDPFARHHAGGEPKPEAEEVRDERVQVERAMRLAAMEIDRDRRDRDVRERDRDDHVAPPRKIDHPVRGEAQQIKSHCQTDEMKPGAQRRRRRRAGRVLHCTRATHDTKWSWWGNPTRGFAQISGNLLGYAISRKRYFDRSERGSFKPMRGPSSAVRQESRPRSGRRVADRESRSRAPRTP